MITTAQANHIKHNVTVNVLDGAFFGLSLGITSYQTVLPLFIATLTDSAVLIGLISALHMIGWQFPQLFTAGYVSRLRRYKPLVLLMTLMERLPYFGLAVVALLIPQLPVVPVLILSFVMVGLQSFGGGFTATAWQSMLGKIIPLRIRGTFYGIQSAAANIMLSAGALIAGFILGTEPGSEAFAICFFLSGIFMMVSLGFLSLTREDEHTPHTPDRLTSQARNQLLRRMLTDDSNFRWFLVARVLVMFSEMAIGFYAIYGARHLNADAQSLGIMTGLMGLTLMLTAPPGGRLGDKWGHRYIIAAGSLLMAVSALVAMLAPDAGWLYIVFGLVGVVRGISWTATLALTVEFGSEQDRPYYIGLSNTLIAPATLIAPLLGGVLADTLGFEATFVVSIVTGLLGAYVAAVLMHDPIPRKRKVSGD